MAKVYTVYLCDGCGKEFAVRGMWMTHIQSCEKHPMYKKEQCIKKLQDKIKGLRTENDELKKIIEKNRIRLPDEFR